VLVVRGGEEAWPPQRVVIGDDGSEGAWRTTGLAGGIGGLFGAEVVLVRAHRNPPEPIGGWSAKDRRRLDETRAREEEALGRRADDLGRLSGNRPETKVIEADATLALLLAAEEGEGRKTLLAVGSRGLGLVGRVRLGSVSINVLRVAEGPVLICPPPREAAVQADRATARSEHPAQTAP
jgi:nucleotide-binding universal stress UspA family protein